MLESNTNYLTIEDINTTRKVREIVSKIITGNLRNIDPQPEPEFITQTVRQIINSRHFDPRLEVGIPLLTREEIENAIEILPFYTIQNPKTEFCPLSHEKFEPNQMVARIRSSGYIYDESELRQWLTKSSHCPVSKKSMRL